MLKGLVFGKFLPFHRGHESLICSALDYCDQLTILVCASDREKIKAEQRMSWIRQTYADVSRINVAGFSYKEEDLPNTSEPSRDVSRLWAQRFSELPEQFDIVVTSEPYGDFVAEYMGIKHVRCQRTDGISASLIRNDIMRNWDLISPVCARDLVRKVSICGTESTGKSTLSELLARHFNTAYVTEAGRDLVPQTSLCTAEDLERIASEHSERIARGLFSARRLLFLDTDIYTTISYSKFLFNQRLQPSAEIMALINLNLVLYLDKEAPYIQDGSRLQRQARGDLDTCHRNTLADAGVSYTLLSGSYQQRFETAVRLVSDLIPF